MLDSSLPAILLLPIGVVMAGLFGAAWAAVPAYLQAYRGSHIVITTIMFNFIASALMVYLMVNVLIKPGQMSPESRALLDGAHLPFMHEMLAWLGVEVARSPLNASVILAVACCIGLWLFIWRTRWGYEIRAVGFNERAAVYGGISSRG